MQLKLLVVVCTLVVAACGFVTKDHHARAKAKIIEHHSLHPPHLRETVGSDGIPYWSYHGAAVVTDNYIRLTPDRQSTVGMVWNTEPIDLPAFEIVLGFRVHSKSAFGADGMALWIVDDIPTTHGNLFGHPNDFTGIGILFDSYDNDRYRDNPAVHVVYNGINDKKEYNPQTDFRGQSLGNCYFDYRNTPRPAMATARIRLQDGTLQVFVSKNSEKDEVLCATVTGITLESQTYFLGLTAETGGISDSHDIHFLHVYPVDGFQYDHDVYEHVPFSHNDEKDQKVYWRAKTPEEEAQEKEEKRLQQLKEQEEKAKQLKEAEEANLREVERRRVLALEKELEEMRKKAAVQEALQEERRQNEQQPQQQDNAPADQSGEQEQQQDAPQDVPQQQAPRQHHQARQAPVHAQRPLGQQQPRAPVQKAQQQQQRPMRPQVPRAQPPQPPQ